MHRGSHCLDGPERPIGHATLPTSVPIPKFASTCGTSDANFGIKGTLQLYDSSVALDLTFLRMTRGNAGRNVKSATLVGDPARPFLPRKQPLAARVLLGERAEGARPHCGDGFARQLIGPLVELVAGVSSQPMPAHAMLGRERIE